MAGTVNVAAGVIDHGVLANGGATASDISGSAETPRWVGWFAASLMMILLLSPFVLLLAPWQQTVRGSGRVVAFQPLDREQAVEAPISGRVVRWWVIEGSAVAKGDPLFEIADIDPLRIERLELQRTSLTTILEQNKSQAAFYETLVGNARDIGALKVEAAIAKVDEATEGVKTAEAQVEGANADLVAARNQIERKRVLITEGAVSQRQLEVAQADFEKAEAKVDEANAKLAAAKADLRAAEKDLERERVDAQAKVNSAQTSLAEARGKVADTEQKLAGLDSDISRQRSQLVTAPRDGVVLRLNGGQGGEIVKQGDPMATLVPQTSDRAVEIWLDGNDVPLVTEGDEVRLQFEGWPAVQFAGWPSVAVGTFGGKIAIVDATDENGDGTFRTLVIPDAEADWPSPHYLRQGVRAKGWVLLNDVTIGWELWRQLNGFPPVRAMEEPEAVARKRLK